MHAVVVTIQMKPEHRDEYVEATLENGRSSLQNEPGCLRFDMLHDESDPNRLYLYIVFKDRGAQEAHRQMPHYKRWLETVKPEWYAAPTDFRRAVNILPTDDSWR